MDIDFQIISNPEFYALSPAVNGQSLWGFYINSGFIYPEKLDSLKPYKQEILLTLDRMLSCRDNTFKIFFAVKDSAIIGSIMASQLTDDTWVIQHLAVLPEYRLTAVAKRLLLAINSWMISNQEMSHFQNYFRQKTKIAYKTFLGMLKEGQNADYMALETKDYLVIDYQSASALLLSAVSDIDIHEIQAAEQAHIYNLLTKKYKPVSLATIGFLEQQVPGTKIKANYESIGLFRERHIFVATSGGRIVGAAIVDTTSVGVNLSHLFDAAHIFIFDEKIKNKVITSFAKSIYEVQKDHGKSNIIVLANPEDSPAYRELGFQNKRTYLQYNLSRENETFNYMYDMIAKGKRVSNP